MFSFSVSSSPHTPQTPSPAVQTPVSYAPQHTSGPHIAMTAHGQPQMIAMPTYVVQQPPQFQTQHPQPRQHKRLQQGNYGKFFFIIFLKNLHFTIFPIINFLKYHLKRSFF